MMTCGRNVYVGAGEGDEIWIEWSVEGGGFVAKITGTPERYELRCLEPSELVCRGFETRAYYRLSEEGVYKIVTRGRGFGNCRSCFYFFYRGMLKLIGCKHEKLSQGLALEQRLKTFKD